VAEQSTVVVPADGIMAGVVVRFCHNFSRTGRIGSMTDHRKESDERERTEAERRREAEERDRRSDELKESWRRNHPSDEEEKRPKRGRPA
jgi:hypothetical protein